MTEGGAQFLLGSIYDVRRGALLREGSVRMVAGSVPAVNLGALWRRSCSPASRRAT